MMRNIYDILSKIDFGKRCEKYALGFYRDTDTPTMTRFRQESMREFCFSLIQKFYKIVLQDHWQEITTVDSKLHRTRKALDAALDWLEQVATPEKCDDDLCREFTKRKLTEIKTALEQKDK